MRRHAEDAGLQDAIIVNTCAVTGEAVRQAAQAIRRLRRDKPEARIIVTGCAAQIEPERFADMPEVDHVIGNAEKMRGETFERLSTSSSERVQVNDIMSVRECAPHMIDGFDSQTRAYVQIQNGCDHRCTFCIIPFGAVRLGARRRCRHASPPARRKGLRGDRADGSRYYVLRTRFAGPHDARQAREASTKARAGSCAFAALFDRPSGSRCRFDDRAG